MPPVLLLKHLAFHKNSTSVQANEMACTSIIDKVSTTKSPTTASKNADSVGWIVLAIETQVELGCC